MYSITVTPTFLFFQHGEQIILKFYKDAPLDYIEYMNLKPFIEEKGCMALNTIDAWQNVIFGNGKDSLRSNVDSSELILHIAFNQFVNISSIAIEAPEESGPKAVKLFINHQTIDFNHVKTIEAVQILKFEKIQLKHGLPIELQFDKFENVNSLSAADELRKNALRTIRYAEFGIPSCNLGKNESIHSVYFLKFFQVRPNYKSRQLYGPFLTRWKRSLSTLQSINDHVSIFEENLSQLVEQLKEFVFLDIRGAIPTEKVEPYRLMAQTHFPNSRIDVHRSRFRLWK
ncbi:unnamed protein product [Rotaria magnacalcarata]